MVPVLADIDRYVAPWLEGGATPPPDLMKPKGERRKRREYGRIHFAFARVRVPA
jgi:hypothetical protein